MMRLDPLSHPVNDRSANGGLLFFVPVEACCAGRQAMHHQGGGCLCSRTVDLCFKVLLQLAHVFSLDLIFLFLAAFALQFITVVGSAPWFGELILLPNWRMFHGCNSWVHHSEGKAWWTMFAQPSGFCNVWWTGRRTLQKATQRKLENWSFQAN